MRYQSTRGNSPQQSFLEILLGGLAPDGGLYLPTQYPQVTKAQLDSWRGLPYADLAYEVLSLYCDDIPEADLRALLRKTYTEQVYCNGRTEIMLKTSRHYIGWVRSRVLVSAC